VGDTVDTKKGDSKRKTMEIIKCPHKNQKHYAKVSPTSYSDQFYRECATIATTSMAEIA
jgi:hypothetical protein